MRRQLMWYRSEAIYRFIECETPSQDMHGVGVDSSHQADEHGNALNKHQRRAALKRRIRNEQQ